MMESVKVLEFVKKKRMYLRKNCYLRLSDPICQQH